MSRLARGLKHLASRMLNDRAKERLCGFALSIGGDVAATQFHAASLEWSLRNMKRLGFSPSGIVDVGAFHGDWTRMIKALFPEARVLMIEAQEGMRPRLEQVARDVPGVSYEMALLGAQEGAEIDFCEMETGSSAFEENSSYERSRVRKKSRTLDKVLEDGKRGPVEFLKLDVQGYELEVLKGARHLLGSVSTVVMEVSLLPINRGAPLLPEVLRFMDERGFLPYDICSLMRRPLDAALHQVDMMFLRRDHALLRHAHVFDRSSLAKESRKEMNGQP